jgi:hypothetical protein
MLPIAATIVRYGADSVLFLAKSEDFSLALSRWLSNFPNFEDSYSRELSRRALTQILAVSAKDIGLASLRLISGTKEEVLLQVAVMSMLAMDLVYDPTSKGAADDFEDDDDDYGEEVMEDGVGGLEDLAVEDQEDMQGDLADEKALVKFL